jgi:phosphohistidine swiveling domain-containing protein
VDAPVVDLAAAGGLGRDLVGGKAGVLGELAAAGFPVPPGFVVFAPAAARAAELADVLSEAADRTGPGPFAVRSSAAAEDLADASYAGLYESFLDVPRSQLGGAVSGVVAAAADPRVAAYRPAGTEATAAGGLGPGDAPAVAVLVQQMVDAAAAGVAFTADPVTGDRSTTVVTAVTGVGARLVSGEAVGEEWRVYGGRASRTCAGAEGPVLRAAEAAEVAALADRVAGHYGRPQDIEWALDRRRRLYLVQARPMTALPDPVDWTPPGPGVWWRNFRIGEWLPEAMTPLFASWLLPALEDGFLAGMRADVGAVVPFRRAVLNGWYYTAPPVPSPALLARVVLASRGRAPRVLFHALVQVSRDPAAADRAVLGRLARAWLAELLPRYRRQASDAQAQLAGASPERLVALVDELGRTAGAYLWSLAIVGGSAWKMEAALTRFCRRHLADVAAVADDPQVLLRGLPGTAPGPTPPHAVLSLDWHEPTAAETGTTATPDDEQTAHGRHARLAEHRVAAEADCRAALADRPRQLAGFTRLLQVTQRYTELREEQARDLTLAWPVLRGCAHRLGQLLQERGLLARAEDVFFLDRDELTAALTAQEATPLNGTAAAREVTWQRQRRLPAPLTLGTPLPLIGDPIARAVTVARGTRQVPPGAIVGQPASAGRATGPVRLVTGPADFAAFADGEVLLAATTAPAFTPLFARAAAVVTDGGTLAAHASLIAREYGIAAVVGTGDATRRLRTGQLVTVDGGAGTVTPIDPTEG